MSIDKCQMYKSRPEKSSGLWNSGSWFQNVMYLSYSRNSSVIIPRACVYLVITKSFAVLKTVMNVCVMNCIFVRPRLPQRSHLVCRVSTWVATGLHLDGCCIRQVSCINFTELHWSDWTRCDLFYHRDALAKVQVCLRIHLEMLTTLPYFLTCHLSLWLNETLKIRDQLVAYFLLEI